METYNETLEEGLVQVGTDNLGTKINSQNGLKATYDTVMILTQAGKPKPGTVDDMYFCNTND